MKLFLLITLTLFAVLPEMLCGNLGIAPGLTLFIVIYISGSCGGNYGAASAVLSGLLLDGIYGRPFPAMTILSLACAGAAALLLCGEKRQLPFVVICGAAAGFANALLQIICSWCWKSALPGPDWWTIFTFYTIFGAFYLPLLALLLDFLAAKSNLPGLLKDNDENDYLRRKRNL